MNKTTEIKKDTNNSSARTYTKWVNVKNIELLQWYYNYLYLGKFLDEVIKHNDLSSYAQNIPIKTWTKTSFSLNGKTVQQILQSIHQNPDKTNVFGYLIELSAFRWIFSTYREMIDSELPFKSFLKQRLDKQYFPFEQIIRLLRNILSHNASSDISITHENFSKQKEYLLELNIHTIHLKFNYAMMIKERKGSKTYGVDIKIPLKQLAEWTPFNKLISRHKLFLLSELCYNLTEIYKQTHSQ